MSVFPCEDFLAFLKVFPFFSKDFGGLVGIKSLFWGVFFLAFFFGQKV